NRIRLYQYGFGLYHHFLGTPLRGQFLMYIRALGATLNKTDRSFNSVSLSISWLYVIRDTCLAESYEPGSLLSTMEISVARRIPLSRFKHRSSRNIASFTHKRVFLRNLFQNKSHYGTHNHRFY